jgi:DNA-binding transcriptional LysR family regulator
MSHANDLLIFAKAVEYGGFAPAAKKLAIPKSTVSKRVAELEAALGVRLLNRTSRSFVLTDIGREVYEHAKAVSAEVEGVQSAVRRRLAEPSGTVRITVPVAILHFDLAHKLPILLSRHPKLYVSVHATDSFVDIGKDGFDVAVRSHFVPLPDSSLMQRRLRVERLIFVASPAYLEKHGVPKEPSDLIDHHGLMGGETRTAWHLTRNGTNQTVSVTPNARVTVDAILALVNAATAGLGVTRLPASYCRHELESGRLIHLMPEWSAGSLTTTVLMPQRASQLPSVRAVVDFLVEMYPDCPSTARQLVSLTNR